jgi:hypothetical protein
LKINLKKKKKLKNKHTYLDIEKIKIKNQIGRVGKFASRYID